MSYSIVTTPTDSGRRRFLLGSALGFLQVCGIANARSSKAKDAGKISLAQYGGVPGASPIALQKAFAKAFARLAALGGGELLVPPGAYDFGSYSTEDKIVSVSDLRNVRISAYGARFTVKTTANITPSLFHFINPNNIVIAGAHFKDLGYASLDSGRRGMFCVHAAATKASSGFQMIDCYAENVTAFFWGNQDSPDFLLKDISIKGAIKNVYYGVSTAYVGENTRVDLVCEDVRRGYVTFAGRKADINIRLKCSRGFKGSNGFICLVSEGAGAGDVDNIRIRLDVSGFESHSALVHFYHQQDEALGYIRNVDATVKLNNLTRGSGAENIFAFSHELPNKTILRSTARGWDRIFLHGSVAGRVSGRVISNPSISTSPGSIFVDGNLVSLLDMWKLPCQFHVKWL